MSEKAAKHRQVWREKKILREVYSDWYRQIIRGLSPVVGDTIELGAGSGNFKEFKPEVIAADIMQYDWLDMCFDAHDMPFGDKSVANLVLIDVLHHLADPIKFFKEVQRVLKPGGRILLIEPYPSLISLPFYRRFHPEPFDFDLDYFGEQTNTNKDPWESNQAMAYLIFFQQLERWQKKFNNLSMIKRERFSMCLWPASGGFENKQFIPDWLIPLFRGLEWLLYPLRPWLAWRCYLVLEREADTE